VVQKSLETLVANRTMIRCYHLVGWECVWS